MTKAERVLSLNGKFIAVVNVDVDRERVVSKDVMLVRLQHVSTKFRSHHPDKNIVCKNLNLTRLGTILYQFLYLMA